MKCRHMPRKPYKYPCTDCENKDSSKCKEFGGKEPITCEACRWYCGIDKTVCYKRRGHNIRTCENFEWN